MANEASQNEFDAMSVKDFSNKLQTDAEFNSRYLSNPQAPEFTKINEAVASLYQKYGDKWKEHLDEGTPVSESSTPQGQTPPAATAQGSATGAIDVSSLADDAEIEVQVKIPKNLFGTYLNGRTPDQAVLEALKGNQHKDATIKVLKEASLATHDDNHSLRNRVKKSLVEMSKPQVPTLPKEVLEAANLDAKNADLLDPDEAERIRKSNEVMASFVKNIQPAQQNAEVVNSAKAEIAQLDAESEFARIRQLQIDDPSLMTTVDFKTLDMSVSSFLDGIVRIAGLSGSDVLKLRNDAWVLYNDSQMGEQFRNKCISAGIVKPAEFDKHVQIMEARSQILPAINEERAKEAANQTRILRAKGRLGANEEVSVDEIDMPSYATTWRRIKAAGQPASTPVPPPAPVLPPQPAAQPVPAINPALQQQIDARRAQTESASVPLVPPGAAIPEVDPGQIPTDTFLQINAKFNKSPDSITIDEAQLLKRVYEWGKVPIPPELKRKLQ